MQRRAKIPTQQQTLLYDKVTKLQASIIDKLTLLKKEKISCECKHFQNLPPECELYDHSTDYYDKFWKTFLMNELMQARLRDSNRQLDHLQAQVEEVQELFEQHAQLTGGQAQKRVRRPASRLDKQFSCPYPRCSKRYNAEVALNLHIRLKHNGGTKTDRQRAAQLILQARENSRPIPNFYINLPPGFVEEYARRKQAVQGQIFHEQ